MVQPQQSSRLIFEMFASIFFLEIFAQIFILDMLVKPLFVKDRSDLNRLNIRSIIDAWNARS